MSKTTIELTTTYARTADLTESERHGLLASERRRSILDALEGRSVSIELDDLAAELAARDEHLDPTDPEGVRRLKAELHHVHLPMLSDSGVLDYDSVSRRIDA